VDLTEKKVKNLFKQGKSSGQAIGEMIKKKKLLTQDGSG